MSPSTNTPIKWIYWNHNRSINKIKLHFSIKSPSHWLCSNVIVGSIENMSNRDIRWIINAINIAAACLIHNGIKRTRAIRVEVEICSVAKCHRSTCSMIPYSRKLHNNKLTENNIKQLERITNFLSWIDSQWMNENACRFKKTYLYIKCLYNTTIFYIPMTRLNKYQWLCQVTFISQ